MKNKERIFSWQYCQNCFAVNSGFIFYCNYNLESNEYSFSIDLKTYESNN